MGTIIQETKQVTVQEVSLLLELGKFLFSFLSPEEIEELKNQLNPQRKLGNTGDS